MSTTITVPGGTAVLRDPSELTNRQRKLLRRYAFPAFKERDRFQQIETAGRAAAAVDDGTAGDAEAAARAEALINVGSDALDLVDAMNAAYIFVYVENIDVTPPVPLPSTVDDVDELPGPLFDALGAAASKLGMGNVVVSVDDVVDPASPTPPSAA